MSKKSSYSKTDRRKYQKLHQVNWLRFAALYGLLEDPYGPELVLAFLCQSLQLDRIDGTKDYGPDNFRRVTPSQNTVNSKARNGRKQKLRRSHD